MGKFRPIVVVQCRRTFSVRLVSDACLLADFHEFRAFWARFCGRLVLVSTVGTFRVKLELDRINYLDRDVMAIVGAVVIATRVAARSHVAVAGSVAELLAIHTLRDVAVCWFVPIPFYYGTVHYSCRLEILHRDGSTLDVHQVELVAILLRLVLPGNFENFGGFQSAFHQFSFKLPEIHIVEPAQHNLERLVAGDVMSVVLMFPLLQDIQHPVVLRFRIDHNLESVDAKSKSARESAF